MSAPICYIDHSTGESDHMNAHIETERCKVKPGELQACCKETLLKAIAEVDHHDTWIASELRKEFGIKEE